MASGAGRSASGEDSGGGRHGTAEPAVAQSAGGESCGLSDSMVGLFDRLREAAETHDGEAQDGE